jgi:hypothetical protein
MLSAVAKYQARRALNLCVLSLLSLLLSPAFAQFTENESRQLLLEKKIVPSDFESEHLDVEDGERRDLQSEWTEAATRYWTTGPMTNGYDDDGGKKGYGPEGTDNGGKKGSGPQGYDSGKKGSGPEGYDSGKKGSGPEGYDSGKKGAGPEGYDSGKKGSGPEGYDSGKKGYGYDGVTGDDDDDDICPEGDDDDDDDSSGIVCEPNYSLGDNPCVDGCGHEPVPNPFNPNPVEAAKEQMPGPCKDYTCLCADSGCKLTWDVGCIKWYMECQKQIQVCGSLADAPAAVQDFNFGTSCSIAPISANTEYCFPKPTPPPVGPVCPPTPAPFGVSGDDDDGSGKKAGYGPLVSGDDDDGSGKKAGYGPLVSGDDDDGSGKKAGYGPLVSGDDDDGSGKKTDAPFGQSVTPPTPPPRKPTPSPGVSEYGKARVADGSSIFGMP